jgi:hypothetical protein
MMRNGKKIMIRICATLCIALLLLPITAAANETYETSDALPLTPPVSSSMISPCSLSGKLRVFHAQFVQLAQAGNDAGVTAEALHHRSTSRAYKRVEKDWEDINHVAKSTLDALAYLPLSLEKSSNRDGKKDAALTLAAAYRDAIESIVEYASMAVYFERTENSVSMNDYALAQTFNFGVSKAHTKSTGDTYARAMFEVKATAVHNAMRTVILPEYRYQSLCKMTFVQSTTRRQASYRPRSLGKVTSFMKQRMEIAFTP